VQRIIYFDGVTTFAASVDSNGVLELGLIGFHMEGLSTSTKGILGAGQTIHAMRFCEGQKYTGHLASFDSPHWRLLGLDAYFLIALISGQEFPMLERYEHTDCCDIL